MSKVVINKLVKASNDEYSKTIIATLLYNIDLSRLKDKAFENKIFRIDRINMQEHSDLN